MGVRVAVLIVLLVALVRVGLTLPLFSQTADEGIHVQAGLQWLSDGLYDSDVEHPPLARIGLALDSFAAGLPYGGWDDDGVFLRPGKYERHLAFARAPNLLFLAALVIGLAAWARLLFGDAVAVVAAGLVSLLPPILAHAGLATTDIAAAATVTIALFTFSRWLRDSTWWNATAAGAACGLGLLSKFSFVIYFPLAASLFALAAFAGSSRGIRHVMLRTGQLLLAASVALLFLSSGYRFS